MDILIHTAERACVLVTLTIILAQARSCSGPRGQIGPRARVAAIHIFEIDTMRVFRSFRTLSGLQLYD
jgi:hypothetical protein